MDKKKKINPEDHPPIKKIDPEVNPIDLDEPDIFEKDPDELPEEDPFESPPDEAPVPGEGP